MATATDYDAVPYPSDALEQTHPDRLAVLGRLYGLDTAPPASCRYLELGCGSGMNLLSMASTLPGSHFHGIDLARSPIQQACADADQLQLRNVTFEQDDIAAMATRESPGEFDYIVAHGVYSWVPAAVRGAMLDLCRKRLAPQGIAYISYNALPGGHIRQLVRDMMRYHVASIPDPDARLEHGRELIGFLLQAKAGPPAYAPLLRRELDHLTTAEPGLIHHDDFADCNQPFYLHEFLADCTTHGLQFLCEAVLQDMQLHSFAPDVRQTLLQMEGDVAMQEQYIDFLKGRRFRQTLLCHRERALERKATPLQMLPRLLLASNARPGAAKEVAPSATPQQKFFIRSGRAGLTTGSSATEAILSALAEQWPLAMSMSELVQRLHTNPELARASLETLAPVVWHLAEVGMIDLRCEQVPCSRTISQRPRASHLARWQVQRGRTVTSQDHTMVRLEGELLPLLVRSCDGTRSVDELVRQVVALVGSRALPAPDHLDLHDASAVGEACLLAVSNALESLRGLALLEA